MPTLSERTYYLKSIDRLLGLAESSKLKIHGYAYYFSNSKHTAFIQFPYGTCLDDIKHFYNGAKKCFRNLTLSMGTTGPDTKQSMYPTIFITDVVKQRNRHLKHNR